jgi:TRAP-type C4-dicarboxylate transport system substrate-binding protein
VGQWLPPGHQQPASDRSPADLKGLKLRVPLAPLYTSMFSALGAAPTGLSVAELYTSLQTKLVDGQENPLSIIDIYKYYEVQKFCSVTNHMWDGFWLLANRRSWDRISDQARPIVAKNLNAATLTMRTDVAKLTAGAADRLRQHGMAVNVVADKAPFRGILTDAGFYTTWRKTYGEEAWGELESTVEPLS